MPSNAKIGQKDIFELASRQDKQEDSWAIRILQQIITFS